MGLRLKKLGNIIFDPKIYGTVKHPNNARDFINQKARIRYGFLKLNKVRSSDRTLISEFSHIRALFSGTTFDSKLCFIYIGFLYFLSWIQAHRFIKRDSSLDEIWKHVVSTK